MSQDIWIQKKLSKCKPHWGITRLLKMKGGGGKGDLTGLEVMALH